jgi:hypothetical protein
LTRSPIIPNVFFYDVLLIIKSSTLLLVIATKSLTSSNQWPVL